MLAMIAFALGAAGAVASSVALAIAGFQWLTTFPFRLGWRRHADPVGKALPDGDPRLELRLRRMRPTHVWL
jgi:hypothetical protein